MSSADSSERTENATPQRMKEVRRRGELGRSTDLTAWLGVGAATAALALLIDTASTSAAEQLLMVEAVIANADPQLAVHALAAGLGAMGDALGPFLGVTAVVVLGGAAAQGGITFRQFRLRFEHWDLVKGTRRIFGPEAAWQGAKALLKTAAVGAALWATVSGLVPVLTSAGSLSVSDLLAVADDAVPALMWSAVGVSLAIAAIDVLVTIRRNRKRTRMTKKEIRDESKSSEGDPLIRAQRRSRQLALSRNRMIAAVAGADVVLVNPTHYAVALAYQAGHHAPRVVAKGAGSVAERIRTRAHDARVPVVQDVPLARALHAMCDVGQEIPIDLYNAVARVLAFVMALRSRGAAHGTHRLTDTPTLAEAR